MTPSLRPRTLAAAAIGGALLGLTFAVAEVVIGYLAGGWFPFRFWAFLALYSIPALALLGLFAQTLRAVRKDGRSPWHPGVMLTTLVFVYASVLINSHRLLAAYPAVSAPRLLALLATMAATGIVWRVLGALLPSPTTDARDFLVGYVVLPTVLTLAGWVAFSTVEPLGQNRAALVFLPVFTAGVLSGGWLVAWLLPERASLRRVGAAGGLLTLLAVVILAHGLHDPDQAARYSRNEAQPAPARARPNVVLIVLDTVRAANMSTYGYPRRTTPYIDAFARKAVRYNRHFAPSSWSLPGHASLFTGLLPSRHGADGPALDDPRPIRPGYPLASGVPTLAEILSGQGYATAGIVSNFAIVGRAFGLDRGFRYYDAAPSADFLQLPFPPLLTRIQEHIPYRLLPVRQEDWFPTVCRRAQEITDLSLRWLRARRAGQPFLLFLNYMDAHDHAPPGRFRDLWPGRSPRGQEIFRGLESVVAGERDITREEAAHFAALYDGSISYLDEQVGRLLAAIESDPEFDDTWVVITSDHGESLGEHRTLWHQCSLHQEILWTPLIIRYPTRVVQEWGDDVHPGAVDSRLVQSMDVLPTLLDGSGFPVPPGLDGRPIREGRDTALAEYFVNQALAREVPSIGRREMTAIVDGDWKLIETTRAATEGPPGTPASGAVASHQFYNLRRDPLEGRDLAWAGSLDMERLQASLARWRAAREGSDRVRGRKPPSLTDEQREVLRAVGYLN